MTIPKPNPDFIESVKLLLQLHERMREGKDDEVADALRDQMDRPWWNFSDEEKELVRGLSADLYTIGVDRPIPTCEPDESVWGEFCRAAERENWPTALELLRKCEAHLSPAQAAYIRAVCWSDLGHFDVAILFFQEERRLKKFEPADEALLLTCFISADRVDEVLTRADEIAANETDPLLLFKAAEIWFVNASNSKDPDAVSMHRKAIEIARRCLEFCERNLGDEMNRRLRAKVNMHMAISFEQLGEKNAATRACQAVLKDDPNDPEALMLHGYLMNDDYPDSARTAFCNDMRNRLANADQVKPENWIGALSS